MPRSRVTSAILILSLGGVSACAPSPPLVPTWLAPSVEAFARPTAALVVPGASRAFLLKSPPTLCNGEWQLRLQCEDASWSAADRAPIRWSSQRGAIAGWQFGDARLEWVITATTPPAARAADSTLLCSIEICVHNRGDASVEVDLRAILERPMPLPFIARDAHRLLGRPLRWRANRETRELAGGASAPATDSVAHLRSRVAPGAVVRMRLVMPSHATSAGAVAAAMRRGHAEAAKRAVGFWRQKLASGARIDLPDPLLTGAWDEALVALIGCSEESGHRIVPIGGPFHYRDTWIRDGARQISALAEAGHLDLARQMAASLLEFRLPGGGILSQRGQLDGMGQALWAIAEVQFRTPGSAAIAPTEAILDAWRWCERQRAIVRRVEPRADGLMPPADPRDAELFTGYHVGTDLWTLVGYRSARDLLLAAGESLAAARVESTRVEYEQAVLRHLAAERTPGVPAGWFDHARPWGNLIANHPARLLPAAHPRIRAMLREQWSHGLGRVHYGAPDSMHSYLGMDLAVTALLDGSPAGWDSTLARSLAWRTATGGGAEIHSIAARDFGTNLPPHATSAAAVISLLRKGLVLETEDTLRITLGTRSAWWEAGFGLQSTPTRWGELDLRVRQQGDELHWELTALPVPMQFRGPPGVALESVTSPAGARLVADIIHAPAGTRSVSARVRGR